MILVDSSIWIDHSRRGNARLERLLAEREVLAHPMVIGELACENLHNRENTLRDLGRLPQPGIAADHEVLNSIEEHRLMGLGLGWVDAHLLVSALLARAGIWTRDHQLAVTADRLGVKSSL